MRLRRAAHGLDSSPRHQTEGIPPPLKERGKPVSLTSVIEIEVAPCPDVLVEKDRAHLYSDFKYIQIMLYFHQMTIEDKRRINERKFPNWEKLLDGGRRYSLEVKGKHGWKARYVKEVDVMEETIKFYQEIYDDNDRLTEIHEKFPVDKGHRKL